MKQKLKKLIGMQDSPQQIFEKMLWITVKQCNQIVIVEADSVEAIPKKIRETCKIADLTKEPMTASDQKYIFNRLLYWKARINPDGSDHYHNLVIVARDIWNDINEDIHMKCTCFVAPKREEQ